jgi:hypothetical protein
LELQRAHKKVKTPEAWGPYPGPGSRRPLPHNQRHHRQKRRAARTHFARANA